MEGRRTCPAPRGGSEEEQDSHCPFLLFSLSLGAKPKLFHEHKSISLSKSHFIWVEKKTGLKKFMKFPLFLPY